MAESKYDKYIIRNAAMIKRAGDELIEEIPGESIPIPDAIDLGFRVFSGKRVKDSNGMIHFGFITEDVTLGTGEDFHPHKHDYSEIFLFLGTNPQDVDDLGAEVEFWLGEGKDMEKVILNTSSSLHMPPGLAHFPQIWRNVKRPVMTLVFISSVDNMDEEPIVRTEK